MSNYDQVYGESKYLRSTDLIDFPLYGMITAEAIETIENPMKNTSDEKLVLQLYNSKPFIVNKTNFRIISYVAKSALSENWIGKIITIIAVEDDRSPFGYVIRVAKRPENQKKFLEAATSTGDLKERYGMVKNTKYKQLVIEISKKWKTT